MILIEKIMLECYLKCSLDSFYYRPFYVIYKCVFFYSPTLFFSGYSRFYSFRISMNVSRVGAVFIHQNACFWTLCIFSLKCLASEFFFFGFLLAAYQITLESSCRYNSCRWHRNNKTDDNKMRWNETAQMSVQICVCV